MAEELFDWKWLPKAKQSITDRTDALISNERQIKSQYTRYTPDPETEYIQDESYKNYAHRHAQWAGLQGDAQAHDMLPYIQGDQPEMEFDYQLDIIDERIAQYEWHEQAIEEFQDEEEHEWHEIEHQARQRAIVRDHGYPAHGPQYHEHYGPRDEPPLEAGDWRMHYDRTGKWISDAHLGDFDF